MNLILLALLIYLPVWCAKFLLKNRGLLGAESVKQKYEYMFEDISLRNSKYSVLYYPVSLIRRFVFALLPLMFNELPAIQL